jgi:hypothetical protein
MDKQAFIAALQASVAAFSGELTSDDGSWSIKGVVDDQQLVYPIPLDTKLSSKIMEMQLHPHMVRFAREQSFKLIMPSAQNHYPDYSLVHQGTGVKFAVDIKTTYLVRPGVVNGMTLGSYFGYMRGGTANITFPYRDYAAHVILGVVYSKRPESDGQPVLVGEIDDIVSPVHDFRFFVHEKYQIALDRPGSGNTRNIGAVTNLTQLLSGTGPFERRGSDVFEEYWCNYLNATDSREAGLATQPYRNLAGYDAWKQRA